MNTERLDSTLAIRVTSRMLKRFGKVTKTKGDSQGEIVRRAINTYLKRNTR